MREPWLADPHIAVIVDRDYRKPVDPIRQWECDRKQSWDSEEEAIFEMHRLQVRNEQRRAASLGVNPDDPPLHVYLCPYGNGHWHIGHESRKYSEQEEAA